MSAVQPLTLTIEVDAEVDGRWLAEVVELPGVMTYGASPDEAVARVQGLALRVMAERYESRETKATGLQFQIHAA